jgi:formylglycine-generating enzyme required for sulfatase activity
MGLRLFTMDESRLEKISERLLTIEKLLESFLSRSLDPPYPSSNGLTRESPLEPILDLIYKKIIDNRAEKKIDRPVSIEELRSLLEGGDIQLPENLIQNMNFLQKIQKEGIDSHKGNPKQMDSIQKALLSVLVYFLEEKHKEKDTFTPLEGSSAEKFYGDFVKMALSDGIISLEDRRLLDEKSLELNLSSLQAQKIEKELMIQIRRHVFSPSSLGDLSKASTLNRRENRILEEAIDTIFHKNKPLDALEDLSILYKKYPRSKQVSEIYYFAFREKDSIAVLKILESISEKSITEHRILIEILAENDRFNDAYDELEDLSQKFAKEEDQLKTVEAYILFLEWKKTSKHILIEHASKILSGIKSNQGYTSYVKHLISLSKGIIKPENISSSLELYYRMKLLISEKPFQSPTDKYTISPNFKVGVNSIGIEFILIPAGEYMMGAVDYDTKADHTEKPSHLIKIEKPFYIAKFPTTQESWEKIMGKNPSKFPDSDKKSPVDSITWEEIQVFIKKLNEMEGLFPEKGYRLPMEIEWEYACRAGTSSLFYFGDDSAQVGDHAWFEKNSSNRTHPVGTKKPNPWGLYDMVGNVWEWCQDWYSEYSSNETNPPSRKVRRGGSWMDSESSLRSSERGSDRPNFLYSDLGFRLVSSSENTVLKELG